jgi:hypothetical protein
MRYKQEFFNRIGRSRKFLISPSKPFRQLLLQKAAVRQQQQFLTQPIPSQQAFSFQDRPLTPGALCSSNNISEECRSFELFPPKSNGVKS